MNIIYKKISLDIHNIASQLTLAVKKGDTARGLIITLTENGKIYNIPDYCYATFSAKKSDGRFVSSGCEIKDNKIIYDFSEQLTTVAGRVDCEIPLFGNNESKITSPLFTLYVYQTIKDEYEEEMASSDEFKTLDKLISETTEVLAETKSVLAESKEATSAAKESVCYIESTEDGRIKLLDFNRDEIITVDVFCGDDDTLYRYSDGMLSVVGIKERNKDQTFRMWVGTNEEYLALPEKDPQTFYWITDDKTFDDTTKAFNALSNAFANFEKALIDNGTIKAHSAKRADSATSATSATYASNLTLGSVITYSSAIGGFVLVVPEPGLYLCTINWEGANRPYRTLIPIVDLSKDEFLITLRTINNDGTIVIHFTHSYSATDSAKVTVQLIEGSNYTDLTSTSTLTKICGFS